MKEKKEEVKTGGPLGLGTLTYEVSSGNVYADLELPNPEDRLKDAKIRICEEFHQRESTTLKDLYESLALAQSEFEIAREREYVAAKGAYPRMADVVVASRPYLTKNGIAVNQYYYTDIEGRDFLRTEMVHSSGQKVEATMRFAYPKDDLDAWQSSLDRFKREMYKAITGVVSDVDDDGLKAMDGHYKKREQATEINESYTPKHESSDFITQEQLNELNYELKKYPDMVEQIYKKWKLNKLHELRKSQFRETIEWVRKIRDARDGLK